jgi:DUF971 family protein
MKRKPLTKRRRFGVPARAPDASMNGRAKKMLKDENISEDLSFSHITVVGRYALNFHFSDRHETGIYSFAYLRKLSD